MWYLIVLVAVVLTAVFLWAHLKKRKIGHGKGSDAAAFRTEKDLETYEKKMDSRSHVDFDDAE
jgi:hypothetical protein